MTQNGTRNNTNEFPKRKQIRLSGYDYSENGYYFVTICAQNRECIFGDIVDNKMVLNDIGKIVENIWFSLPRHHPVELGTFQIMPNHIHFIIVGVGRDRPATNGRDNTGASRRAPTLGFIVGMFKTECTKQINQYVRARHAAPLQKLWQRNYYEHVIRNEKELYEIQEYIELNPKMWDRDRNNPNHLFRVNSCSNSC